MSNLDIVDDPTNSNLDDPAYTNSDAGQTTAEYALVILAAGTLALAAILWARDSGSITDLFENIVERLTGGL
jgi:hypothetical protein